LICAINNTNNILIYYPHVFMLYCVTFFSFRHSEKLILYKETLPGIGENSDPVKVTLIIDDALEIFKEDFIFFNR